MNILHFLSELGTLVAAFIIVLDPLAVLPILVTIIRPLDPSERRHLVYRVTIGATVLLVFFIVTGTLVLKLFGVTLDDLRIGGGLLLIVISFNLVLHGRMGGDQDEEYRAAVVPVISPFLIGPGAITAAVVLAAIHGVWITTLAALISMLICMFAFMGSGFICRLLGESGTALVSRVMGVLIATIGVSYVRSGILALINGR